MNRLDDETYEQLLRRLDHEMERTLAMTPAEIRADLEEMGYDIPALEREAREFLRRLGWRPPKRRGRFYALVPLAAVAAAPFVAHVPEMLPLVAQTATESSPAPTAALPPEFEDGGSHDDARSR